MAKGKEAVVANDQARAFKLYSAGIGLDPTYDLLFVHRSNENLRRNSYVEALSDAEQVRMISMIFIIGLTLSCIGDQTQPFISYRVPTKARSALRGTSL